MNSEENAKSMCCSSWGFSLSNVQTAGLWFKNPKVAIIWYASVGISSATAVEGIVSPMPITYVSLGMAPIGNIVYEWFHTYIYIYILSNSKQHCHCRYLTAC